MRQFVLALVPPVHIDLPEFAADIHAGDGVDGIDAIWRVRMIDKGDKLRCDDWWVVILSVRCRGFFDRRRR